MHANPLTGLSQHLERLQTADWLSSSNGAGGCIAGRPRLDSMMAVSPLTSRGNKVAADRGDQVAFDAGKEQGMLSGTTLVSGTTPAEQAGSVQGLTSCGTCQAHQT